MKSVLGIVQARISSTRLPGKVLLPLNGKPAICYVMDRAMSCADLCKVYLATSTLSENSILEEMAGTYKWLIYRGDENDVLSRFIEIVNKEKPDMVVRINADNFAVDPDIITHGINELLEKKLDVCTSFINNTYPFGAGAEISTADCLLRINKDTRNKNSNYREHIFSYAYEHSDKYSVGFLEAPKELRRPDINISVDTKKDYEVMKRLYGKFKGKEVNFTTAELIEAWDTLPK